MQFTIQHTAIQKTTLSAPHEIQKFASFNPIRNGFRGWLSAPEFKGV
jgi:hypothetical protein